MESFKDMLRKLIFTMEQDVKNTQRLNDELRDQSDLDNAMIPVGLPSLINPMNTPATDKTRSNSHSMSIDRRAITESHESI